jgi:lipoprotein-releasing system permease protein
MKQVKNYFMILSISVTHLRAKSRQTFFAILGVVCGIAIFIFLLAYVKGLNGYYQGITLEQTPHLRLFNEPHIDNESIIDRIKMNSINIVHHSKPKNILPKIKNGIHLIKELERDNRVKAISGTVKAQVFYNVGGITFNGQITGINYDHENSLLSLENKIIHGNYYELTTVPNSIVMGVNLSKKLNLTVGDKLIVTTENGNKIASMIVGVFKTGIPEIDIEQCYANINTVQTLLGVPSSYLTEIKIRLHDKNLASSMTSELSTKYNVSASNWQIDNVLAFEGEAMQNMIVYCVAIGILLVAGSGIFNILNMMIYEKMKDIAILKAIGFTNNNVRHIFLYQAFIIGFLGSIAGLIMGFLISYGVSYLPYESELFSSSDRLPISFDKSFYITGFVFGIVTSLFSGYFPSRKASKIDPVFIIRG